LGLTFYVRLAAITISAAACAQAQEYADRSVSANVPAAVVGHSFSRLPAKAHADSLPPDLQTESAIYVQRRLGEWRIRDASEVLGEPRRRRDAYKDGVITGDIYAFTDPTNRYREFELLFDHETKTLRSAFIYPWSLTWVDCKELWGEEVNTTAMANGNKFRSYLNRRLDVLVDKAGKVINLGIY
jgi:hypothetical protein